MRYRRSETFTDEKDAQAFLDSLPPGSEPLLIPVQNPEDKHRGLEPARILWFRVAYWTTSQVLIKGRPVSTE